MPSNHSWETGGQSRDKYKFVIALEYDLIYLD